MSNIRLSKAAEKLVPFTLYKCTVSDYKNTVIIRQINLGWSEKEMTEKRTGHRREYKSVTRFPLNSQRDGLILSERRRLPTRRLNDIEVKELSYQDFISELR